MSTAPKRLLYILDNYWPHVGGAERAFGALCEGMAARGHDVTVLTQRCDGAPSAELRGGVRIVRLDCASRYAFTLAAILPGLRLARTCDVVHAATFNAAAAGAVVALLSRKPIVLTVFETWLGRWRHYSDFPAWKAMLHDIAERAILTLPYTRYVGISKSTSTRLCDVIPRARTRCTTIYFDFDPAAWHADTAAPRPKVEPSDRFVIVGFGRPGTSKGFAYLIDAVPLIRKEIPQASLVLVLSEAPQYAGALRALKARATDGITFVPSLPTAELVSLVRSADCVAVPSLAEGFGYTTLEAVAAGVPVVASDTTSIPEVIGGSHVLVRPRDAAAIARGVVAVSRGDVASSTPRTFPLSETLDRFEALYDELR